MTTDIPDWVLRLPDWVHDDEIRWLSRRPWIAGFIRPDDYTLNRAVERFEQSQRLLGAPTTVADELVTVRGIETTSLRYATTGSLGVVRGVSIQTLDAARIKGLAVPYGERSSPVQIQGIRAYEQFDRNSFEYLPTSVPLRVDHDQERPPLGTVTSLRHTTAGLAINANIDPDQRREWAHRWIRGEHSSLSIGFVGAPIMDDWTEVGGMPLRTPRHAQLVEVSVVRDPAYLLAHITEVLDGDSHAESERVIADYRRTVANLGNRQ